MRLLIDCIQTSRHLLGTVGVRNFFQCADRNVVR